MLNSNKNLKLNKNIYLSNFTYFHQNLKEKNNLNSCALPSASETRLEQGRLTPTVPAKILNNFFTKESSLFPLCKQSTLNSKRNIICKSTSRDLNSEFLKKNELFVSSLKNTKGMQNSQNSYSENQNIHKKLFRTSIWGYDSQTKSNFVPSAQSMNKQTHVQNKSISTTQNANFSETSKQQVVSITYEEIGLFPRSFNRVFDRFFKQLFFDVENLVIQEYRFYRYLFLTTVKCLVLLIFVPLSINFLAKNYLIRPVTEYYWNTHNHEIFLNSYQQKRAFTELKNFEEKIYFESLLFSENQLFISKVEPWHIENQLQKNVVSIQLTNNNEQKNYSSFAGTTHHAYSAYLPSPSLVSLAEGSGQENLTLNQQNKFSLIVESSSKNKKEQILEPQNFNSFNDLQILNTVSQNLKEEKNSKAIFTRGWVGSGGISFADATTALPQHKNQQKNEFNNDLYIAFTNSLQKRLQIKIFELANHYNEESIEAVTNFFADVLSFSSLCFLLVRLEIQINITKSFLLEVFFGLDDSKKSLLILFITDLLVGYHSPNIWELFFQTLFDHYGLPESQTTIFLLVATLPVLLDVLFKYLIFRHLNRASPATVATYHAMIE